MGLFSKLQNGDTVLKSLKFGNDRPGGGDSGQPYIQDPIPLVNSPANTDFILRGGINAPLSAAQDVARLTKYMFSLKSPSGLLFTAKQNLLSRISPKTEATKGIGYAGGALNNGVYTPLSTLAQAGVGFLGGHVNKQGLDPTGLISSLSIKNYGDVLKNQPKEENRLVNILSYSIKDLNGVKGYDINQGQDIITYGGGPGSILGIGKTHIRYADQRTGVNNSLFSSNKNYFLKGGKTAPSTYIVKDKDGNYKFTNTLNYNSLLGVSVKEGLSIFETGINENGQISTLYNPEVPYSTLSKNPNGLILTGSNGYQIGDDLKNQTQKNDTTYKSQIKDKLVDYGRELLSDSQFDDSKQSGTANVWAPTSQGKILPKYTSAPSLALDSNVSSGTDKEIADKLNSSNNEGYLANLNKNSGPHVDPKSKIITFSHNQPRAGGRGIATDFRAVNREKRGFTDYPNTYDYVTTSSNYSGTTIDKIYYSSNSKRQSNNINNGKDLINFRITAIDPRNPNNSTIPLNFRAYIDSFSDSYNADWKGQTYMGRAEQFYKYNSFGRDMSLNFTIVADSKGNLNIMYTQLNTLASSLAPTYTTFGYMAGNLHQLTVGNYVSNQTGIMNSLSYDIMDESPWQIESNNQLPFYIKVSIKFTPIHNFRPEMQWDDGDIHQFIRQTSSLST
jgi:hypothetical protein